MNKLAIYRTIIIKELSQRRVATITFCLIGLGFLWLYTAMYPSLTKSSADITAVYKAIPKSIMQAFNIELADFSFNGFLASKHFDLTWPLMAILLSLSLAGNIIAGEIEQGTMSFLLAQPVPRRDMYIAKYLAGATIMTIFVVCSILTIIPLTMTYDISSSTNTIWLSVGVSWFFAMAIFSLGFFISSLLRERSRVYFLAGGLIFLMYIARVFSVIFDQLSWLRHLSLFYYYNANSLFGRGTLNLVAIVVFGLTVVFGFGLGLYFFQKRDI